MTKNRSRRLPPRACVDPPFPCPECGQEIATFGYLRVHMTRDHALLGKRGISIAIDRFRWPGQAAAPQEDDPGATPVAGHQGETPQEI